jgi:flagellar assembly protein FliH
MSSSAARTAPAQPKPFPYEQADASAPLGTDDAAPTSEEQYRRDQEQSLGRGRLEGQQQARAEFATALEQQKTRIETALREFSAERESYYRRVEAEVVQLALAVARKILHREAQLDPQMLAGIVRITLEKLDAGTSVHLYVHPSEAADWRHYFACRTDAPAPEVHEDPALLAGACRIETSLGTTEAGLEVQLKEIETGLLDLLAERPGTS